MMWSHPSLNVPSIIMSVILLFLTLSSAICALENIVKDESLKQIYCRKCGNVIATSSDYIEITASKAESRLSAGTSPAPEINPTAYLHNFALRTSEQQLQLATFEKLINYRVQGKAQSTSTLFPGYEWTAIVCPYCKTQIGWLFKDVTAAQIMQTKDNKMKKQQMKQWSSKLESMTNRCFFHPQGYWVVRFCHERDIIQYHQETNGKKDPIYSLGTYDTSGRIERPRVITSGQDAWISHFFLDGQPCDETNRGRKTEVQFMCCKQHPEQARILTFDEYSKCKYRMKICTPSMCDDNIVSGASFGSSDSLSIAALVNSSPQKQTISGGDQVLTVTNDGDAESTARIDDAAVAAVKDILRPQDFFALRWSSVISDDSSELMWTYAAIPILSLTE